MISCWGIGWLPAVLPTSMTWTSAPSSDRTLVGPRRSVTTTSARASHCRPETVSNPGSPGPPRRARRAPPRDRVGSAGSGSTAGSADAIRSTRRDPGRGRGCGAGGGRPSASRSLIASRMARARPGSPPPETATCTPSGPVATAGTCAAECRGPVGAHAPDPERRRPARRSPRPRRGHRWRCGPATSGARRPARALRAAIGPGRLRTPAAGRHVVGRGLPRPPGDLPVGHEVGEVLADRRGDHRHPRPGRERARSPGARRPARRRRRASRRPARSSSSG